MKEILEENSSLFRLALIDLKIMREFYERCVLPLPPVTFMLKTAMIVFACKCAGLIQSVICIDLSLLHITHCGGMVCFVLFLKVKIFRQKYEFQDSRILGVLLLKKKILSHSGEEVINKEKKNMVYKRVIVASMKIVTVFVIERGSKLLNVHQKNGAVL